MSLISPLMPVPYYGTLIVGGSIRVTGTVVSTHSLDAASSAVTTGTAISTRSLDAAVTTGTVVSKEGRSQGGPCPLPTGVGSGGYAGDLTPQLFMWRGY